MMTKDKYAKE